MAGGCCKGRGGIGGGVPRRPAEGRGGGGGGNGGGGGGVLLRPAVRAGDCGRLSEKPEPELRTEGAFMSPIIGGGGGGASWGREAYIRSPLLSSSFI